MRVPILPELRPSPWNAPTIGTLVVGFASVVVTAVGGDAPRWAFLIPLASLVIFVGVVLGPPAWRWRQARRFREAQRDYLRVRWPQFHALAEEFADFFGSNKIWSVHSLAVHINPTPRDFAEHVTALNAFAYSVERATRIVPDDVVEAQDLLRGLDSAVSLFETRGVLTALRQLELKATDAELREKFLEVYGRFKGKYAQLIEEANRDLGEHVFSEPSP